MNRNLVVRVSSILALWPLRRDRDSSAQSTRLTIDHGATPLSAQVRWQAVVRRGQAQETGVSRPAIERAAVVPF